MRGHQVARLIRWGALVLGNVAQGLYSAAGAIEGELLALKSAKDDAGVIYSTADIRRAAAGIEPTVFDDHPPEGSRYDPTQDQLDDDD